MLKQLTEIESIVLDGLSRGREKLSVKVVLYLQVLVNWLNLMLSLSFG